MATASQPIIIIGAGVAGLVFAQACRKANVPFRIFERDAAADFRPAGWALTLNWSLPMLKSLLPEDTLARLPDAYVNKVAQANGENGSFPYYDLSTGGTKWSVPAGERIRVSRERLRTVLLTSLDVEWSKGIASIAQGSDGRVEAKFTDGSTVKGYLLVGCDGAHSKVRRLMNPQCSANWQLPIRLCGAKVTVPESQIKDVKSLDPYFFQGGDPCTDVFTYTSFIDAPCDRPELAPSDDGRREGQYVCQIMISWPYRQGFLGQKDPIDVAETAEDQLAWMKSLTTKWAEPFRSLVQGIPDDAEVKPIDLTDWVPSKGTVSGMDGRVALMGDSAHAMVMYRGEGANHAIADVYKFVENVLPLLQKTREGDYGHQLQETVESYAAEAVERGRVAVLMSRQACLDGHDQSNITKESPLVAERRIRADK